MMFNAKEKRRLEKKFSPYVDNFGGPARANRRVQAAHALSHSLAAKSHHVVRLLEKALNSDAKPISIPRISPGWRLASGQLSGGPQVEKVYEFRIDIRTHHHLVDAFLAEFLEYCDAQNWCHLADTWDWNDRYYARLVHRDSNSLLLDIGTMTPILQAMKILAVKHGARVISPLAANSAATLH